VSHNARNALAVFAIAGMLFFAYAVNDGMFASKPGTSKLSLNSDVQGVVSYTDGTKRTFDLSSITMFNPLIIVDPADANKTVTNIEFDFFLTAFFTGGPMSSYSVFTSYYTIVGTTLAGSSIPNTSVFLYKNSTTPITLSGSGITSGLQFSLTSISISAANLQGLYSGWTPNTKYYWAVAFNAITMSIVFPDGTSGTQTLTSVSCPAWLFYYESPRSFNSVAFSYMAVPT
jgi:hypothetical protein